MVLTVNNWKWRTLVAPAADDGVHGRQLEWWTLASPPAADARARAVEERIVPAPRGSPSARRGGEDHHARPVRLFERTPGRGGPFPPSEVARATPALSQALSDVTVRLCGVGTCRDPYVRSYVFWERIYLGFLEGKPSTLAPLGPCDWRRAGKSEKTWIRRFQVFSLGGPIKSREITAMIGFLGRTLLGQSAEQKHKI